eukprot:3749296-Pyramimonas_sp.AAC.1
MGDPYIVAMFLATFSRPILGWGRELWSRGPSAKDLNAQWGDIRADLSLIKYADNLNKAILADFGTSLEGFLGRVRLSDERRHVIAPRRRRGPRALTTRQQWPRMGAPRTPCSRVSS